MTRFQKLVAATLASTLALVIVGVVVRASGSGLGCPDWPLCAGQLVPLGESAKAWAEWIHRFIAAGIGFLVAGVLLVAVLRERARPSVVIASAVAFALVLFQAWLGRETVRLGNSGDSVTAHLATALAVVGVLVFILVRSRYQARFTSRGASQRFTILAVFTAAATFALLLFGANVTANDHGQLLYADWPLFGGALVPPIADQAPAIQAQSVAEVLHRYVGLVVGLVVLATWVTAWRTQRANRTLFRLMTFVAICFPIQALVGAFQVWTHLAGWAQSLHVAFAAFVWTAAIAAVFVSWYGQRAAVGATEGGQTAGAGTGERDGQAERAGQGDPERPGRPRKETVRAYVALTKPRIIELLLVTTVPAMVLATRNLPGVNWLNWGWLVVWTLVGGTLAAGSANAINQYLDRDIDLLMSRTRRRPLPAHAVEPEQALVFGVVLGIFSVALIAFFVNLVAAFLTLLAIAFYVVIYTALLKRTTTQNIVIGGAAGALPPVIGWAAVTGNVGLPALFLFALVFYWTPPHFWALALRITKDYAAAGVPMLPVVRGSAETTRQILLYTILLVAISLMFAAVGGMGMIYLVSAVVLGGLFIWRAAALARTVTVDGTTAGAIRLYRYSITYLTALMAAVAIDTLLLIRLG